MNFSASHRLGRQRARFVQPGTPQPSVDAQRGATALRAFGTFVI
jgi:hypothetical protein